MSPDEGRGPRDGHRQRRRVVYFSRVDAEDAHPTVVKETDRPVLGGSILPGSDVKAEDWFFGRAEAEASSPSSASSTSNDRWLQENVPPHW